MAGGRPPKPIAKLKASGAYRSDRHAHRQAEPTSGASVTCPDWLAGDALDFWNANVPLLETMGVLDGIDQVCLAGLATAWANWRKEQADYESGTGHINRVSTAWATFDRLASKFGFSPVERTKLAIEKQSDEPDPFEQWLKAGGLG